MEQHTRALDIFKQTGVLQEGHFRLTSGRHSARYMQCARVFQYPAYAEELCKTLAFSLGGVKVDAVIGPAIGAIQMAYEVSRHLGCRNLFAEREEGEMKLRRGFSITPGESVLVVEDTVTTGGSVKEVLALVLEAGGIPVGVGSLVDRSGGKVDFGVPFTSVVRVEIESWPAEDCPLCRQGLPIQKPGSRKA